MNKKSSNSLKIKIKSSETSLDSVSESTPQLADAVTTRSETSELSTDNPKFLGSFRRVNHIRAHIPEPSQILMRSAVQKPTPTLKRRLKVYQSTDTILGPSKREIQVLSSTGFIQNKPQTERTKQVQRSDVISHFGTFANTQVATEVAETPKVVSTSMTESINPEPFPSQLFEHVLSQEVPEAQQKALRSKRKWLRPLGFAATTIIALNLIFVGHFGYTKIQLSLASAKAGFATSLPSYNPGGFGLHQLSYSSGIFASEFLNKKSGQSYTVTQKKTTWDSHELLTNYVSLTSTSTTEVKIGSLAIYLYSVGDATWIKDGIWYQLNSDGSLNQSQIIDLVNSL